MCNVRFLRMEVVIQNHPRYLGSKFQLNRCNNLHTCMNTCILFIFQLSIPCYVVCKGTAILVFRQKKSGKHVFFFADSFVYWQPALSKLCWCCSWYWSTSGAGNLVIPDVLVFSLFLHGFFWVVDVTQMWLSM